MFSSMRRGARVPMMVLAMALAAWIGTGSAFAHGGGGGDTVEADTAVAVMAAEDTMAADITAVGTMVGGPPRWISPQRLWLLRRVRRVLSRVLLRKRLLRLSRLRLWIRLGHRLQLPVLQRSLHI